MPCKKSVVLLAVFKFWVEMSWAFSWTCYVVVGPLTCEWESDNAAKEILVQLVGGGRLVGEKGGRAIPVKTRVFDCTLGFPGEDVAKQPQR